VPKRIPLAMFTSASSESRSGGDAVSEIANSRSAGPSVRLSTSEPRAARGSRASASFSTADMAWVAVLPAVASCRRETNGKLERASSGEENAGSGVGTPCAGDVANPGTSSLLTGVAVFAELLRRFTGVTVFTECVGLGNSKTSRPSVAPSPGGLTASVAAPTLSAGPEPLTFSVSRAASVATPAKLAKRGPDASTEGATESGRARGAEPRPPSAHDTLARGGGSRDLREGSPFFNADEFPCRVNTEGSSRKSSALTTALATGLPTATPCSPGFDDASSFCVELWISTASPSASDEEMPYCARAAAVSAPPLLERFALSDCAIGPLERA